MRLRALVLLAAVVCLAAKYKLETTTDEFTGHTYHMMDGNKLGCQDILGRIDLDAQQFVAKEGESSFQLFVHYSGTSWMFIRDDVPSLLFLIDGKPAELTPANGVKRDTRGAGGVYESAMYEVEPDLLIALAGAKMVKIRVRGEKYPLERCFSEDNFTRFKEFVALHVKSAATEKPSSPPSK